MNGEGVDGLVLPDSDEEGATAESEGSTGVNDESAAGRHVPTEAELLRKLMKACEQGNSNLLGVTELEDMLEERDQDGAPLYDVNGSVRGVTPLMIAAKAGHAHLCLVLLANGADINATDEDQLYAYDWAKVAGQTEVLELLEDHGAGDRLLRDAQKGNALAKTMLESRNRAAIGKGDRLRAESDVLLNAMNDKNVRIELARNGVLRHCLLEPDASSLLTPAPLIWILHTVRRPIPRRGSKCDQSNSRAFSDRRCLGGSVCSQNWQRHLPYHRTTTATSRRPVRDSCCGHARRKQRCQ